MKLQHLSALLAVVDHHFNLTITAQHLFTTQPAISKYITQLEEDIGVSLFERRGRRILGLSKEGEQVYEHARRVMQEVENIRTIAHLATSPETGLIRMATTHTQARYYLPTRMPRYMAQHPKVKMQLFQHTPVQNAKLLADGQVDIAICTEVLSDFDGLLAIPCYRWNRLLLVPHGHPLTEVPILTLSDIAAYPLISYSMGFTGRGKLDQTFRQSGIHPNIVITASDADVIKTYVRLGLGVGIVAEMAYESETDSDFTAISLAHLFPSATTWVAYQKHRLVSRYMFDFIRQLSPMTRLKFREGEVLYEPQEDRIPLFGLLRVNK
ncbi:MAG: LysR family transcriptional regulator [Bacteroidetes Order II. Incertae sedis bacterium]|nr:LysR family transcriptional regulator [Bacteroidetes Order II. bacterium]